MVGRAVWRKPYRVTRRLLAYGAGTDVRGRLNRLDVDWRSMSPTDLLDTLYSMLVDDASGLLISRDEAIVEVDKVLFEAVGEDESTLRSTWGVDRQAARGLAAATSMFGPAAGSG